MVDARCAMVLGSLRHRISGGYGIRWLSNHPAFAVLVVLALSAAAADAATVSVSSAEALVAALAGTASEVIITAHLSLAGALTVQRSLSIRGLCSSPAASYLPGASSDLLSAAAALPSTACVLVGGGGARILSITGPATVALSGLLLANGTAASGSGGGVSCAAKCMLSVASVAFVNCVASVGGGLFVDGTSTAAVANSYFASNSGASGSICDAETDSPFHRTAVWPQTLNPKP